MIIQINAEKNLMKSYIYYDKKILRIQEVKGNFLNLGRKKNPPRKKLYN